MTPNLDGALRMFDAASSYAKAGARPNEIEWLRRASFEEFTETDLLREAAWVILCSGFRERIVRKIFDHVSLCFCDWESASAIVETDPICRSTAMASFRSASKLQAIVASAGYIHRRGFRAVRDDVLADPVTELRKLPYIGPVTVWHLAKNLGLDVAKPDRHLARVSAAFGYHDVDHFCDALASSTGEQKKVVDLIVWRYLADHPHLLPSGASISVGISMEITPQ